jgi:signal transduction histidine kinase
MTLVYLITADDDIASQVMAVLPPHLCWLRFPTLDSLVQNGASTPPDLVLIDFHPSNGSKSNGRVYPAGQFNPRPAHFGRATLVALLKAPEERAAALAAGVDDCLTLPLNSDGVAASLANYLPELRQVERKCLAEIPTRPVFGSPPGLDARESLLRTARMAVVGRLTASFLHEINNPLQAIRGALTLAREDMNDSLVTEGYLLLALQETERVVSLIERLRGVYRSYSERPAPTRLNPLIEEALELCRKELSRNRVKISAALSPEIPRVQAVPNQLLLANISMILSLCDYLVPSGGEITVRTHCQKDAVWSDFTAQPRLKTGILYDPGNCPPNRIDLSLCQKIITDHHGTLQLQRGMPGASITIRLPAAPEEETQPQEESWNRPTS